MYAGQNGSADANPHLVLYDNGTTVCGVAIVGIRIVVDGDKIHFRADEYAIADRYTSTVKEGAALLNPTSFANVDVLAVIHIERRQQCRTLINLPARNTAQILMHFFRREPAFCIHFRCCSHCVEYGTDKFVIARFIG